MTLAVVVLTLLFTPGNFLEDADDDGLFYDMYATTPAWHIGKLMYTINATEYLKPFHNVDDQQHCREEKCKPQDCQYAPSLIYDNEIEKEVKCSCHIACYSSGRCCLNFEEVCLSGQRSQWVVDTFPYEEALIRLVSLQDQKDTTTEVEYYQNLTELRTQMISVSEVRESYGWHSIVNKCSACGPNSTCQNIKNRCEKNVLEDLVQFVPVVVNRQLYENRFCAQCSGADMDSVVYISNSLDVSCPTNHEELAQLFDNGDQESILRSVKSGQCKVLVTFNLPETLPFPFLIHHVARKCDDRYRLLLENYNEIDTACRSYLASLAHRRGPKGFGLQNEHCALCNLHPDDDDRETWCMCTFSENDISRCVYIDSLRGDTQEVVLPFFRIALDFRGKALLEKIVFEKCTVEEYLDVLHNQCVQPECRKGTFKFHGKCLSHERFDFTPTSHLPVSSHNQNTGMCIHLETDPLIIDPEKLIEFFNVKLNHQTAPFKGGDEYFFNSMGCRPVGGIDISSPTNASTDIFYGLRFPENKDVSVLKYFIEEGPTLMSELQEKYPVSQILVQFEAQSACPPSNLQRVFSDFTIIWDDDGWLSFALAVDGLYDNGKVYLDEMDMALNLSYVSVVVSISRNADTPGEWQVNKSALVCFKVNDSCPPESMTSGDCLFPVMGSFEKFPKLQFTWDAIFTLIFACLSCVALIITLVLHLLVPEIMKSGGRSFVQLILSLLLAEICLAFGMFITRKGLLCTCFAAVQHFAWLCTFVWTALLSSDLFKALALGMKNDTLLDWHKYQHLTHCLIGWGLPAVIVACCGGLHSAGLFEYGGHRGCWISSPIQLGLSFGLPVAVVVAFNATLYIMVAVTLHRQMEASAAVGRGYDLRTRFVLYGKMSTVVGFTWIFGFLANIEELRFMSYVFSISAGLNGLLLSASFTLSSGSILIMKQKWADFTSTRGDRRSGLTSQIRLSHGKPRSEKYTTKDLALSVL